MSFQKTPLAATRHWLVWCCPAFLIACASTAHGVVIYGSGTDGDGRNLGAPTGQYANSGYQYEGTLNISTSAVGTAIAPNYFITASHVFGNLTGRVLTMTDGSTHTITAEWTDTTSSPNTDLAICQVSTPFTSWAPLYTGGNETGLPFVDYGTGTNKGATIVTDGVTNGWQQGTADGQVSWGTGTVSALYSVNDGVRTQTDIGWFFGSTSSAITSGDSAGGLFVLVDGVYELAGVNHAMAPDYSTSADGSDWFDAAIYDPTNLYDDFPGTWEAGTYASLSLATEIDQSLAWVDETADLPEPGTIALMGTASVVLLSSRRRRTKAEGER